MSDGAAQMNAITEAGLTKAAALLDEEDFTKAAQAADDVLLGARLSVLSKCALVRGRALLGPLMQRLEDADQKDPTEAEFREAWVMFQLALRFVPENAEAQEGLKALSGVVSDLSEENEQVAANHACEYDVVIVGAGASGVGVALQLTGLFGLDPARVLLVERGTKVGETFRKWPREMRFISPSFNSQGWTQSFDLNSVAYGTLPAFTLHAEHPTGAQYADYLEALAETNELNVKTGAEVVSVKPFDDGFDLDAQTLSEHKNGFEIEVWPAAGGITSVLRSRYVVWAAGEFQYPRAQVQPLFPGSELCRHNSSVRSWAELEGDDFVVIGGYESGMDAASNLSTCEKKCTVVSSTACWDVSTEDPSTELAPYTSMRIRWACASAHPPRLLAPLRVVAVAKVENLYEVTATWGAPVHHEGGDRQRQLSRRKSLGQSRSKIGMMKQLSGMDASAGKSYQAVAETGTATISAGSPSYPTTMVLAVLVDAAVDGFLIGISAARRLRNSVEIPRHRRGVPVTAMASRRHAIVAILTGRFRRRRLGHERRPDHGHRADHRDGLPVLHLRRLAQAAEDERLPH